MAQRGMGRRSVLAVLAGAGLAAGCRGPGPAPTTAPSGPAGASGSFDPASWQPPVYDIGALRALFAYDATAPSRPAVARSESTGGVRVEQLSFAHPLGGAPVSAYRLGPTARRDRLPAVVFGHGGGSGPTRFLDEARQVARLGAVVLVPEVPFDGFTGRVDRDSEMFRRAVVAARHAIDVLVADPRTDPARTAYLGHSWGATQAALLAGVEPRLGAVVLMATGGRLSSLARPVAAGLADPRAYLDAMARFDAVNYVSAGGRRQVLLQTGNRDTRVPEEEVRSLLRATAGRKVHRRYDTGHDVDADPQARTDRIAFLRHTVDLGRPG